MLSAEPFFRWSEFQLQRLIPNAGHIASPQVMTVLCILMV
ncbi:hypothetical protein AB37_2538 [Escherichia coli 8-415-05_S1_C2]|nr:hypothetical protein AB09_2528 [Escherichia coli 8-415-05_S1_C1]KEO09538.1 hypothetical protein AB37_2538 [Escherichia coli 8-415-05_S1_C2]